MSTQHAIAPYRRLYALLLHLYPKPYHARYARGMEQTFSDLLRETAEGEGGIFGHALWMFTETFAAIVIMNVKKTVMENKRIVRLIAIVLGLLMIPFIAMQLGDEVVWSVADFIVMGALLFGTGLIYELMAKIARNGVARAAFGVAIFTGLLMTWVNLAVGIIGSEDNPANILFVGVYVVAAIGAVIARFETPGMARTMIATAIAQMLVPLVALIVWRPDIESGHEMGVVGVFAVNAFFATLWLISAGLFRNAAGKPPFGKPPFDKPPLAAAKS